ncbi:putative RNA methyltransferase [Paenibacillus mendelii]|uniref:RNA methyltransferase n=2 Tax=Paenibacillus mendelii TaxID=206163 RepID=A0ABV6J2P3_9BACL
MIRAGLISEFEGIFRCPICFSQMRLVQYKSLRCNQNHCFDLSKQGYVNVLSVASKTKYDKRMFESRRVIYQSGFFEPMYAMICNKIIDERVTKREPIKILDAGCGEGSHLHNIQQGIEPHTSVPLLAVGMDISKTGIRHAAMEYPNAIWCVADLANSPFDNEQFNTILNILSPANYSEFKRMITDDGMVIKVIPGRGYLKELRSVLYEGTNKQVYVNDSAALDHFQDHFELRDVQRVQYGFQLDEMQLQSLLHMTPLSWGTTEERLREAQEWKMKEITIDLTVLYGRK